MRVQTILLWTAVVLAVASIAALAIILGTAAAGGHAWTGFTWIAMGGMPIAFVLLCILVIMSVRRRRML